jgi:hypothetical protein
LAAAWDQGVVHGGMAKAFECALTPDTWDNIAGLVEPFIERTEGFQWLNAGIGEAAWLFSADGRW